MNKDFSSKLQLIDRMRAIRVEAEELNALSLRTIGKPAPIYNEVDETDYLDKADIRFLLDFYLAGKRAVSTIAPAAAPAPVATSDDGAEWVKWDDMDGEGEPPVDVDDAIAYRMKNGEILSTDYPHCLNWSREDESSDIVEYRLLTVDEVNAMTPWVEWTGGECPIDPTTKVQTRLFCYGRNDTCVAGLEQWQHNPKGHRNFDANIVAYRVVTP
jgi:hypothetical protein